MWEENIKPKTLFADAKLGQGARGPEKKNQEKQSKKKAEK